MRVVICGAGVAGVALACQLAERGDDVCLVESAPELRDGGYMIDFFGPGYDTAERMGLLGALADIHQPIENLIFVDSSGKERLRVPYPDVRAAFNGRHFNFPRGDLVSVLDERLRGRARTTFGTTVASFTQSDSDIEVELESGQRHTCDLLVGADGVHSRVRTLMMREAGDPSDPLDFLGYNAICFVADANLIPEIDSSNFYMWTAPGHIASVYPMSGQLAVFLSYAANAPTQEHGPEAIRRVLQDRYADAGWIFERLIDGFDSSRDHYFDEVSQVTLTKWHQGRVVLLGDACQCVSLLAGQGASLAMGGAEVLARQLESTRSVSEALDRYQAQMLPAVARKQKSGRQIADWFVPATAWHAALSRMFMRMLKVPGLRRIAARGIDSSAIGNPRSAS